MAKMKNIAYTLLVILLVSIFLGCIGREQTEPAQQTGGKAMDTEKGMDMETGMDKSMEKGKVQEINPIDRNTAGLETATTSRIMELSEGSVFGLAAKPVIKNINGYSIRMYSYNGQIPGPMIKVKQGSNISVNFTNDLDVETTVHWHGIRLENKFDGVPGITQKAVKPGENFLYKLYFPDEGIYWYHTHIRDDIGQELGLYGNILVEPSSRSYFNPVDKEVALFLDDIKIVNGDVEPFSKDMARFALTGRFGDIALTNGETDYQLNVKKGEAVRFYLTSSSNTRPFNFLIGEHKLKLVGGDSGKYEKESFVDSVILGVSERYIVEVLFDKPGVFKLLHNTPANYNTTSLRTFSLGTVSVSENPSPGQQPVFFILKENKDIIDGIEPFKKYFSSKPDYEIDLTVDVSGALANEIASMPKEMVPIEWDEEENMYLMNRMSTSENVKWILRDKATGKDNPQYEVKAGDINKIRIFNDPDSMHPMQHPMHLHGQRFLVISQDGKLLDNLVWKDTVLVPAGSSIDILVEFTNPGKWLMHCHIPEHAEAGMIASFNVRKKL